MIDIFDPIHGPIEIDATAKKIIDTPEFHSVFSPEYRRPTWVRGGVPVGKWTPDKDTSYLYFDKTAGNYEYVFFTPKRESVNMIYREFEEAINPFENEVKKNIREHLCQFYIYRWTDFDANDTDPRFVYFTGAYLHDDNLNVIMRTNFAQPVKKRTSDEIMIRVKEDF